jgi:KaiC/GvpD/RAD55 family RecA-like ATPase
MVFGLPKSGKSTLCIDFAKFLAEYHGKVLYVAIEEGFGYTLKEKFERLGASILTWLLLKKSQII